MTKTKQSKRAAPKKKTPPTSSPGWSVTLDAKWKVPGVTLFDVCTDVGYVPTATIAAALEEPLDEAMFFSGSAVVWVEDDNGTATPLWLRKADDGLDIFDVQAWSLWGVPSSVGPSGRTLPPCVAVVLENKFGEAMEIPLRHDQLGPLLNFISGGEWE